MSNFSNPNFNNPLPVTSSDGILVRKSDGKSEYIENWTCNEVAGYDPASGKLQKTKNWINSFKSATTIGSGLFRLHSPQSGNMPFGRTIVSGVRTGYGDTGLGWTTGSVNYTNTTSCSQKVTLQASRTLLMGRASAVFGGFGIANHPATDEYFIYRSILVLKSNYDAQGTLSAITPNGAELDGGHILFQTDDSESGKGLNIAPIVPGGGTGQEADSLQNYTTYNAQVLVPAGQTVTFVFSYFVNSAVITPDFLTFKNHVMLDRIFGYSLLVEKGN